jgi:hypothetical protein
MSIEMLLEYLNALNKLISSTLSVKHRPAIEEKILAVCKEIDKKAGIQKDEVILCADGKEIGRLVAEQIEIGKSCKGSI